MKTKLLLTCCTAVVSQTAHADYTFTTMPGPYLVTDTVIFVDFNDAGNSAGVASGAYGSYTMTVDWAAVSGDPWSVEARMYSGTSAGVPQSYISPSAGDALDGNPTTLTFNGFFNDIYNPDVDGLLYFGLRQNWENSSANWSNMVVTLEEYSPAPPPSTLATFNLSGGDDSDNYTDNTFAAGSVTWIEIIFDGVGELTLDTLATTGPSDTEIGLYDSAGFLLGTNDDSGGLLSSITFNDLDAGTYYAAASAFNTVFGLGYQVTSNGEESGPLTINATVTPEPSSLALLAIGGLGLLHRRRSA